jgi:plasmid stabilization system protein ParE
MILYDFHPEALLDLDEIWGFIRKDSIESADRMIAEIVAAVDALVPFPRRGHRRTDITSRLLRFIQVRDYVVAYAPDKSPCG